MPEPGPPNPFAAAGGEFPADKVDPDWLYFLQHVRPDGHSYVLEVPAHGASPAVSLKYEKPPVACSGGDAQSASGPSPGRARRNHRTAEKEEEEDSSADPPWYKSDGIDEDYRIFLRHMRVVNDRMVLEIGGHVVTYDEKVARSGGSSEAEGEKKDGEEDAAVTASGEDGVGEEEEIGLDGPGGNNSEPDVRDCRAPGQKVQEDQEANDEEVVVPASGKDDAGKDRPMAAVSERDVCGWRADPVPGQKIKVEEEEEQLLNTPAVGTPNILNREPNSSNGHDAEPHIAAGLHGDGVIWPTHIIERPESGFKQRLMHVLGKPFGQGEYEELYGMATIRKMALKERRTRSGVKYYDSIHEKSKSYYDRYPAHMQR